MFNITRGKVDHEQSIRFPPEIHREITRLKERSGRSYNGEVIYLLRYLFDNYVIE